MDFKIIGKLGAAACSLLLTLVYFLYTVAYFIGYHNAKNTSKVFAPVDSLGFFFDILFQNEWLIWLALALCLAIIFFGGRDLFDLAAGGCAGLSGIMLAVWSNSGSRNLWFYRLQINLRLFQQLGFKAAVGVVFSRWGVLFFVFALLCFTLLALRQMKHSNLPMTGACGFAALMFGLVLPVVTFLSRASAFESLAAMQRSFLFDALTLLFVTVGLLALSVQFFLSLREE